MTHPNDSADFEPEKPDASDMGVGDTGAGDMSVGDMSVGDMSVGDMRVGDQSVGDMSVGEDESTIPNATQPEYSHSAPSWIKPVVLLGLFLLPLAYIGLTAWLQASLAGYLPSGLIQMRIIDVLVFVWCFWVSSSIGSFLNVVAYRLPRGKSLNGRSHCPSCDAQLGTADNIPFFGWILLGGKCRYCGVPISKRYPLVELAVGLSITLVAFIRIHDVMLPRINPTNFYAGYLFPPELENGDVWPFVFFFTLALTFSWTFGLIRFDGTRIPKGFSVAAVIGVAIAMLIWPIFSIESWKTAPEMTPAEELYFWQTRPRIDVAVGLIASLIGALLYARVLGRAITPFADLKLDPLGESSHRLVDMMAIFSVPTLVVGWQAGLAIAVVSAWLTVFLSFCRRLTDPLSVIAILVPLVFAFQLGLWGLLHDWSRWPSDTASPYVILAWAFALLAAPWVMRVPTGGFATETEGVGKQLRPSVKSNVAQQNEGEVTEFESDQETLRIEEENE